MKNRIGQEIVETEKKATSVKLQKAMKEIFILCEEFFLTNTRQKTILKVCFIGFFRFLFPQEIKKKFEKTVKEKKDTI